MKVLLPWLLLVTLSAPAADAVPASLTVTVENVRNGVGVVGVLIFRSPQGWPEHQEAAFRSEAVPARGGDVSLSFSDLPQGDYGVVVLHDENRNQKLDRNWLGAPKEQWGMSNNPPATFSAPSFARARFHFTGSATIHIRLR